VHVGVERMRQMRGCFGKPTPACQPGPNHAISLGKRQAEEAENIHMHICVQWIHHTQATQAHHVGGKEGGGRVGGRIKEKGEMGRKYKDQSRSTVRRNKAEDIRREETRNHLKEMMSAETRNKAEDIRFRETRNKV